MKTGRALLIVGTSVHVGDDARRHDLAVLFPVLAVLFGAVVVVARLSVDEESCKVDGVKVRYDVGETCREAARKEKQPVTQVVDMASHAPPARDQELAATFGLDVLEIYVRQPDVKPAAKKTKNQKKKPPARTGDAGTVRVGAELVLLEVGQTEDYKASNIDDRHKHGKGSGQMDGVVDEVPCLRPLMRTDKRNKHRTAVPATNR